MEALLKVPLEANLRLLSESRREQKVACFLACRLKSKRFRMLRIAHALQETPVEVLFLQMQLLIVWFLKYMKLIV